MVRKGNPISVRLGLNRSSDSSRFSEGDRANRILVLLFIFVFILTISYWVCAHYQLDFSRIFRRLLFMIVGSGISVFFRRLGWGLPPLFSSLIISMADPSYASGDAPADLNQPDADGSEELGETFDLGVLEESWPSSGTEGTSSASVNQPEGPPFPRANLVSEEAGPSNQTPPVVPFPYTDTQQIGGDSVSIIQARLLSNNPDPSWERMEQARIDAQDRFEVKVEIFQAMDHWDPAGGWLERGARALDNPRTASGEEPYERLCQLRDDLQQTGPLSDTYAKLKDKLPRRR
uniref:DUF8018 domain-containing protein n=1 Tax=Mirabilis jalapa TaxID=3538 RepID=A0A7T7FPF1_MIRJA|nr:hypothetical protein KYW51_mgp24 [Mirabilis jalapa]QQL93532.1 hypothetical protein [Mirabilis jalapa]